MDKEEFQWIFGVVQGWFASHSELINIDDQFI
jgi:hypothetical protein